MKRLVSMVLVLAIIIGVNMIGINSMSANAYSYTSGIYCYTIKSDGTAALTFNESSPTQSSIVNIPSRINGYTVTSFSGPFFNEDNLITINLPSSIKEVDGIYCYSGTTLKNINVNDDNPYFKSVNGVLFSKDMTKLVAYPNGRVNTSYTVPNGVKTLCDRSIYCQLKELTLPNSLESIGGNSIIIPASRKIIIPKNVKVIKDWAIVSLFDAVVYVMNPNVKIGDFALGYCQSAEINEKIYGYPGSSAEKYVLKYKNSKDGFYKSLSFVSLKNGKEKKNNPISVKSKTFKVKSKKLRKHKVVLKKAIIVKYAKGAVSYKKISGSSKIKINKKGTLSFKKGKYKKGSVIKIILKVKASGNATYFSGIRKVTLKIIIR